MSKTEINGPDDLAPEVLREAQTLADRLPSAEAYEALKRIKRKYPKSATLDVYLFKALDKLGLKEAAGRALENAMLGWSNLRADAKDRLIDAYCTAVIKDPGQDYVAEGLLAPSRFIEGGVRQRLYERLASNPRDVAALRWLGSLTTGAESVFYLRLAVEADTQETFARKRLLRHIAEQLAFSVQTLPDKWNGDIEADLRLLAYSDGLLGQLGAAEDSDADYWRPIFDRYNVLARDHSNLRNR